MSSYIIIYSDAAGMCDTDQIKSIETKVKRLLEEGWTCIGGVVISFCDNGYINRMYQTMVKSSALALSESKLQ
jgi:hypothetical protein